jgi:prenylcysteine alpha-carboxyl methylesterase
MRRRGRGGGAQPGAVASSSASSSSASPTVTHKKTLERHWLEEMTEQVDSMSQRSSSTLLGALSGTCAIAWSADDKELIFLRDGYGLGDDPSVVHRPLRSPRPNQQQQGQQGSFFERQASHRVLGDFSLKYHATTVIQQTLALLRFLLWGTSAWIIKFVRLVSFVVALLPAFIVFAAFYFITSDRIALPYVVGRKRTSRHYLDIYGSTTSTTATTCSKNNNPDDDNAEESHQPLKPVVLFLTGGAWIIGYKMWGALMARTLAPFGILVVIPDYRNFPQCNVPSMIQDADQAVEWTLTNIQQYGGDPNNLVICGQSAGAHIGACLLLQKAQKMEPPITTTRDSARSLDSGASTNSSWEDIPPPPPLSAVDEATSTTSWEAEDIKGFIGVSGPYDLVAMEDILHQHGLDKSIVSAMFGHNLQKYSPTRIVRELTTELKLRVQQQFPPTCIIHGQVDKTVPFKISLDFFTALQQLELPEVRLKLYPSWSHTDPILEAPFAGNHLFHRDVYDLVKLWTSSTNDGAAETDTTTNGEAHDATTNTMEELLLPFDENHPACRKICPLLLVQIARFCNPF